MAIKFVKPTVEEVRAYCTEKGYNIDAEYFVDYYESIGWVVGKKPMKMWKPMVATWAKNQEKWAREENTVQAEEQAEEQAEDLHTRVIAIFHKFGCKNIGELGDSFCDISAREKTLAFILLYLTPTNEILPQDESFFELLMSAVGDLVCKFGKASFTPINVIKDYILSMPYCDFLKTHYWKALSHHTKKEAEFKCAVCDSTENLQAHHKHYKNHGDITKEVDDLVCLCADCHAKIHGKYQKD